MAQIAAIVAMILARVATILGIVESIKKIMDPGLPGSLAWQVQALWNWMSGGAVSYASFYDGLHTELATVLTAISDLSDKIDTYTHEDGAQVAVNLPITAPAGYGGGSTAAQVWNYVLGSSPRLEDTTADQTINAIYNVAQFLNHAGGFPASAAPFFTVSGEGAHGTLTTVGFDPPAPDWTDILAGDTVLSWLQRTETNLGGWSYDAGAGSCYTYWEGARGAIVRVDCRLSDAELQAIRTGFAAPGLSAATAPVWPGVANVTLGTPVSIANGASSAEDCDGVIVAISGVPADQGSYTFGSDHSYVHLGQLAFIDDSGDYEDGQNFGFAAGIITPKRMAHAAGFTMRVKSGVSGTVTPWVNA